MIKDVGFNVGLHYLYCRVKNAHGRAKLVSLEHATEVDSLVSLHKQEKKINLCMLREKPALILQNKGISLMMRVEPPETSEHTLSQVILSSQISNAQLIQYRL